MALEGATGREMWRHYSPHELFGVNCNADLDSDGVNDCMAGGRANVRNYIVYIIAQDYLKGTSLIYSMLLFRQYGNYQCLFFICVFVMGLQSIQHPYIIIFLKKGLIENHLVDHM